MNFHFRLLPLKSLRFEIEISNVMLIVVIRNFKLISILLWVFFFSLMIVFFFVHIYVLFYFPSVFTIRSVFLSHFVCNSTHWRQLNVMCACYGIYGLWYEIIILNWIQLKKIFHVVYDFVWLSSIWFQQINRATFNCVAK